MGENDNRKPATPEQIESMKTNTKLTLESSYHELYVDMVLMEALHRDMLNQYLTLKKSLLLRCCVFIRMCAMQTCAYVYK